MITVFAACGYNGMDEKEFRDFLGKFAAQARELLSELNEFVSSRAKMGTGTGSAANADAPRPAQSWIMA